MSRAFGNQNFLRGYRTATAEISSVLYELADSIEEDERVGRPLPRTTVEVLRIVALVIARLAPTPSERPTDNDGEAFH